MHVSRRHFLGATSGAATLSALAARTAANLDSGLDSGHRPTLYWSDCPFLGGQIPRKACISAEDARMIKKMIFGSMGIAGLVALLSILDLSVKFPFAGYSLTLDIMLLVASAIVGYLSWETYRENR